MYKNLFFALAMLFAISTVSYSQDVSRSFSVDMCANSGNVNPDAGTMHASWAETGVNYSQNFAQATWLTLTTRLALCTSIPNWEDSDGDGEVNAGHAGTDENLNGYASVEVDFAGYASITMKTSGLMHFYTGYGWSLPANQSFSVGSFMCVYPFINKDYGTRASMIDFRATYGVKINDNWRYGTQIRFRFKGDEAKAFGESFNIRYNNTITYNAGNGMNVWGQISYRPSNLANDFDVVHSVQLLAGVNYSYDM